jgi:hypothetical protein
VFSLAFAALTKMNSFPTLENQEFFKSRRVYIKTQTSGISCKVGR